MFEEDQKKEARMKSSMAILNPRIRGDQNLLVSPRQYVGIVANLDTSERTAKRRRRRRRISKILILSPRRKMEMLSSQPWPLMQVTMHG